MPFDSIADDFDAPHSASRPLLRSTLLGGVVALLVLAFLVTFTDQPWPELPGFVWAHAITYIMTGTVMAVLLAYQAYIANSRWIAVLAGATLFEGWNFITFFLTFPGTLVDGVLIGGSQSAVWTYQFGHLGFIGGLLLAAVLALLQPRLPPPRRSWANWSLVVAALGALAVGLVVVVGGDSLPVILDRTRPDPTLPLFHTLRFIIDALSVVTLVACLFVARTRSRARVWLVLAAFITLAQSFKASQADDRFTAGWYMGRLFGMAGFTLLLVVLILEVLRQARELVARREESLRLAQTVEQSPVGQYLVDNELRVLDLNGAFTRLTGFSRDDLLGKPLPIVPDPGSVQLAMSLLERLRSRAAESVSMRVQLPRKGKSALWADWTAHAILDRSGAVVGSAGTVVDATDAMAMDLDIQVPVGVALLGRDLRFTQANAALCNMAGRSPASIMNAPLFDILHDEDRDDVSALIDRITVEANTSSSVECRLERPDGSIVWTLLYANRLSTLEGAFDGATLQIVDINERKAAEAAAEVAQAEIEYRARFDQLTGLLNHQSLVDSIDEMLSDADAQHHVAVVLLDIDGFQAVSNALTRPEGDRVLREFAALLVEQLGSSGEIARLGADEFGFAMHAADGMEVAQRVQRLMQTIADHEFDVDGKHIYLTVSVGVTLGRGDVVGADLLQEADMAMRQAQRLGRGNWQMFTHEYRAEVRARIELTRDMHEALRHDEFKSWYMPIVRLDDRVVDGFEALVRWHSLTGLRPPDAFLRVAEETGMIVDVGSRVFDQAVHKLLQIPEHVSMSINASPTQLLRGDVFFHVKTLLAETGIASKRVIVEITEQSLFEASKASDANLFQLADLGVGIHVDDFGTGYSSITHIRDFPITGLKLDTSFTAGLDSGHTRSIELAGILGELTHRLGIQGIAEGVETESQAVRLRELGWTHGQGWLFGKPDPEPQLAPVA